MVDPALVELRKLIAKADSDSVKLQAIKDVLDRTGYKLPDKIEAQEQIEIRVEYVESPPVQIPHTNGHAARLN